MARGRELARRDADGQIPLIQNEATVKGLGRSGALLMQLDENDRTAVERVLDAHLSGERDTPVGNGGESATELESRAETLTTEEFAWLAARVRGYADRHGFGPNTFDQIYRDQLVRDQERLTAFYRRESQILIGRRNVGQSLAQRPDETPAAMAWALPTDQPSPTERDGGLTQLYAKWAFERDLALAAVAAAESGGLSLACVFVDLDDSKLLNKRYGHPKADEILTGIAAALQSIVRGKGRAYRFGGDEFTLLLINHTADEALAVAERIRQSAMRLAIEGIDGPTTVTIGVAILPDHAGTARELIESANKAMYAAKEAGKNTVRLFGITRTAEATPSQAAPGPRIAEANLVRLLRYAASPEPTVRQDAATQLVELCYGREPVQDERLLSAAEVLLTDADDEVRKLALHILLAMMTSRDANARLAIAARYGTVLQQLAQHDRNTEVRSRALVVMGQTGSPEFLELLLDWVHDWSPEDYTRVGLYAGLTQLTRFGLADEVRDRLRDRLEQETSDPIKLRWRECLREVNSIR